MKFSVVLGVTQKLNCSDGFCQRGKYLIGGGIQGCMFMQSVRNSLMSHMGSYRQ